MRKTVVVDRSFIENIPSVKINEYRGIAGESFDADRLRSPFSDAVKKSRKLIFDVVQGWEINDVQLPILPIRPTPIVSQEPIIKYYTDRMLEHYNAPTWVGENYIRESRSFLQVVTSIEVQPGPLYIATFMPDYGQCQGIISVLAANCQQKANPNRKK